MNIVLFWYVGINAFSFLVYGIDKKKAINNEWRISEKFLLGLSVLGGGIGAFCGMRVFHHKTQKMIFRIWVPLWIVLHIALLLWGNERINFIKRDDMMYKSITRPVIFKIERIDILENDVERACHKG